MDNNSSQLIQDMEDSQNISFEEMAYENPEYFITAYFYRCKSYIKEQKARLINERGAISIVCIETNLSNEPNDLEAFLMKDTPIINGFSTIVDLSSNNIEFSKQNFNDSKSIIMKQVEKPIIDVNIPLDFLIDEIYIVSFKDLSLEEELNYDEIFLIDSSDNKNPLFITPKNIEQVQVNRLELIPVSNYNNARNSFISINKIKPILKDNILSVENNTKLIFSMNNQELLFSNIQGFSNIISQGIENIHSCEIDIYNNDNDNIVCKFPVKLCPNNFNEVLEFDNEWLKNVLNWNIAKNFIIQDDLQTILTIKNIPMVETVYNNVKLIKFNLKTQIHKYEPEIENTVFVTQNITNNYYGGEGYVHSQVNVVDNYLYIKTFGKPYDTPLETTLSVEIENASPWFRQNEDDLSFILLTSEGQTINTSGNILTSVNSNDIEIDLFAHNIDNSYSKTINNVKLLNNNIWADIRTSAIDLLDLNYHYFKNINGVDYTFPDNSIAYKDFYTDFKISDKLFTRFVSSSPASTDNQLIVKLFKSILKYTVNYRLGFPGAKFENVTGNPVNDMAKLKVEFEITGTNPLENISNKINNFKMLNPWVNDIPEWDIFLKCIAMISQYIYSTYSLNTGVKSEEEVTLPYYFKFLTPAIKIGSEENYIYDYVSLQCRLESKYFDFTKYNDDKFDGNIFLNKLSTLNSKLTVSNQYLRITYPFINSSIIETQTNSDPQKYDITNEDYQRYILYFITTINTFSLEKTNKKIFDDYMNTLFQVNKNYVSIKNEFEQFTCVNNNLFISDDNTIIGDLPFSAIFNDTSESDILESSDNTIIITENTDPSDEPIISNDNTIFITKIED